MPLTTLDLRKMSLQRQVFFICLANFLTDETSILHQFFLHVLFVWCVSMSSGHNSLNATLMRKITRGWSGTALNGFVADTRWIRSSLETFFGRTNPLFVATFSTAHREMSFNYVFGCQNIANPPFLRKG